MIEYEQDKTHSHREYWQQIWAMVRAESQREASELRTAAQDVDSMSFDELERLTRPEA